MNANQMIVLLASKQETCLGLVDSVVERNDICKIILAESRRLNRDLRFWEMEKEELESSYQDDVYHERKEMLRHIEEQIEEALIGLDRTVQAIRNVGLPTKKFPKNKEQFRKLRRSWPNI